MKSGILAILVISLAGLILSAGCMGTGSSPSPAPTPQPVPACPASPACAPCPAPVSEVVYVYITVTPAPSSEIPAGSVVSGQMKPYYDWRKETVAGLLDLLRGYPTECTYETHHDSAVRWGEDLDRKIVTVITSAPQTIATPGVQTEINDYAGYLRSLREDVIEMQRLANNHYHHEAAQLTEKNVGNIVNATEKLDNTIEAIVG